jgi:CDGSH-type Zn-finger protein
VAVKLMKDGPLLFDGVVHVTAEDGSVLERSGKVSLCRCGGTANQPFCDGSHKRVGFRSAR